MKPCIVHDVPIQIMDLAGIGGSLGEPRFEGIVGTVFLSQFLATIDYQHGRLDLRRQAAGDTTPAGADDGGVVAVPFWLADDHLMLARGTVNDAPPAFFLVDTGLAGPGFTCPPSTLERAGIEVRKDRPVEGAGAGGAVRMYPFVVDRLTLGGLTRFGIDGVAGAFPPQLEWDMGFQIAGLVSHQFFRPGALTLDFSAMRLLVRR